MFTQIIFTRKNEERNTRLDKKLYWKVYESPDKKCVSERWIRNIGINCLTDDFDWLSFQLLKPFRSIFFHYINSSVLYVCEEYGCTTVDRGILSRHKIELIKAKTLTGWTLSIFSPSIHWPTMIFMYSDIV